LWRETFDEVTTCDKGHGRLERRTLQTTTALTAYLDWPDLAQVGRVEAEVTREGKTTREVRYFITSVPRGLADARQLLQWVRGHWSIENRSHYVRDVTLGEDASRVRQGSGPQVLAAVRNAALGLLRQWGGFESIAEALRRNAARVPELFTKLGIL
jgi:predicted transposase YbfD/YdcC